MIERIRVLQCETAKSACKATAVAMRNSQIEAFACKDTCVTISSVALELKVLPFGKKVKKMKVEIISRETIKPSSPTPPHLRNFRLSLLDQLVPPTYTSFVFIFPSISSHRGSDQLKKSLSETLSRYYPFAGRFKDGFCNIDCNDEGADYKEAHFNCELSKFLEKPDIELLNRFLPYDSVTAELDHHVVQLAVQVSNFDCGGLAIGMCFLHKIIDASSLTEFVKDWASITRGSGEAVSPNFLQDSLYPSRDLSALMLPTAKIESSEAELITTRKARFVFTGSSIATLKAKVTKNISSSTVKQPTRVEVVSSLIWQCILASYRAKSCSKKHFFLARHSIDMRKRLVPPLPGNTIGNMSWSTTVSSRNESESELADLVLQLREAFREIDGECLRPLQGDEWMLLFHEEMKKLEQIYSEEELNSFCFTSFCRFPLYEADFGWGKPAWVGYLNEVVMGLNNIVVLMDTRDGDGIEAWVTLDERTMADLEVDKDLLAFASFNPSVDGIIV